MKNKIISMTALAILLSACSAPKKEIIPLHSEVRKNISSTNAYLSEPQNKIDADVESSNVATYGGGGLLLALVDVAIVSYRSSTSENAIEELQTHFEEFKPKKTVEQKLTSSLKSAEWMHAGSLHIETELTSEKIDQLVKTCKDDALLTSKIIYKFNPDLSVLTATIYLELLPTGQKIRALTGSCDPIDNPIFKINVKAAEALPARQSDKEDNAKAWNANNGEPIKKALEKITNQLFTNLDSALKNPEFVS